MPTLDFIIRELTAKEASFSFSSKYIAAIQPLPFHGEIIGQPRAMRALKMAVEIPSKGYNMFVTGDSGTGRTTAVRHVLNGVRNSQTDLQDIVCIHNFTKPDRPRIIYLPAGRAVELASSMRALTHEVQRCIIEQLEKHQKVKIDSETVLSSIAPIVREIAETFPDETLEKYLSELQLDLREFSYVFTGAEVETIRNAQFFLRYTVHILSEHGESSQPPIVFEYHPTHANLFGFIDSRSENRDDAPPPFLSIHGGSLMEASGGYIVLNAVDILREENLWDQLKRVITTGSIHLHSVAGGSSHLPSGIKPDPINVRFKVIMIGDEEIYDELYNRDPDFAKLFKVAADFDYSMEVTETNIAKYIGFIHKVIEDESLLEITSEGIAEVLRFACGLAEQREYLSTQFSRIADTIREAHYWAGQLSRPAIDDRAVLKALEERQYISSLPESKIVEQILTGETLIHLEGSQVGVANALAVLDRGNYSFGIPAVISATVAPGNEGIVNIEHEAGLSGEIHDKGLLILEGYLRKMYARNFPLSIYAGICFEQSYVEVDGDSASSSELYALLSAVGEIPIRQDVAVTGSVNQMGEVQPVGGINEKITGFFAICRQMGLTGRQGVIIPKKNIRNLILPKAVVQAIEERKFHIYPVETIDQGMEILTQRQAGKRTQKGLFPVNTINRIIEDRLKRLYDLSKQHQ